MVKVSTYSRLVFCVVHLSGEMETSEFKGFGRGIQKINTKFSDQLGNGVKSRMTCGRGSRLLQASENWSPSSGRASNTSSYVSVAVSDWCQPLGFAPVLANACHACDKRNVDCVWPT